MPDVLSDFSTGGSAFNVAIYVIISMTIIVGITYLISRVMNNRKLEDWSKNEFMQVIISAAIVGALFLLMNPGTGLITTLFTTLIPEEGVTIITTFGGGSPTTVSASGCLAIPNGSVLCFAHNYLSLLEAQIAGLWATIFSLNYLTDLFAKFSIDLIILEISPFAGLSSVVQVLNSVMQSLLFLGIILGVEIALLHFINATALTVFLPIGVVLRSFFATRRVGGALMALAVGLYIVFPLTIALNAISVEQISAPELQSIEDFKSELEDLNIFASDHFTSTGDFADSESWMAYLGEYSEAMDGLVERLQEIPKSLIRMLASLVVQIVVLPVLSIMLTLISIKELANIFGSEVNLSRFEV